MTVPNYPLPSEPAGARFDDSFVDVVADFVAYRNFPYPAEGSDYERLRESLRFFLYGSDSGLHEVEDPLDEALRLNLYFDMGVLAEQDRRAATSPPSTVVDPELVGEYAARIREYPDHTEAITLGIISALVTPGLQFADPIGRIRAALAAQAVVRGER